MTNSTNHLFAEAAKAVMKHEFTETVLVAPPNSPDDIAKIKALMNEGKAVQFKRD